MVIVINDITMNIEIIIQEIIKKEITQSCQDLKDEILKEIGLSQLNNKYLSRKEVSEYLGISIPTVDNYVKYGLPKHKIGRSTRFLKSEVDDFVQGRSP